MKLTTAFMSTAFAVASASPLPIYGNPRKSMKIDGSTSIKADSPLGHKVLSKARNLEEDDDFLWLVNYELKFQGCHHISQWNEEADGEEDVRVQTKRLVRFRMCPAGTCAYEDASGCDDGYGDYIIGLQEFMESYFEYKEQEREFLCEQMENENNPNGCNMDAGYYECQWDDNVEDAEDKCEYDCLLEKGMEMCVEDNPYEDDDQEEFEPREYMECANWEPDNDNGRRKMEEDEIEYFIGPYCAEQGGAVFLGLFTDETCTQFADEYGGKELYYDLQGDYLPYAEKSLVGMECAACKEPVDVYEQNDNDQQDEDEVREFCEEIYQECGKCETLLADGTALYPNENACNYIEGIKIVRQDGTIVQEESSSNKIASIFIGIFAVSFVLLGGYVYYLKTKLDRAKINLSE